MKLEDHATVRRLSGRIQGAEEQQQAETVLNGAWLRRLARDCGADDAGLVEMARPGLDPQREEILRNYPWAKSLLSLVVRMAREPVRGAPRSVANLEFHRAGHQVNEISAAIVAKLEARGVRAVNPSMGFPMEMYQTPSHAIWVVSHKPVAVEAGLGHMGIHRNLIHPRYGNFVLLGTVLIDREASDYNHPIDMIPPFQSKQSVQVDAPLEVVWEFSMDLTKIPSFHPRVFKVDLLSGKSRRGAGVAYQCHLVGGKHLCTEKDVELVPMEKFVTILPEDTFGISKLLPDYRVETTFRKVNERVTAVTISHYYSTWSLKARLFNLIGKRKIARETYATLNSIKAQIEHGVSGDRE